MNLEVKEKKRIVAMYWLSKDGHFINITRTHLLRDFRRFGYVPDMDELLDWRSQLRSEAIKAGFFNTYIVRQELAAVDYRSGCKRCLREKI